MKRQPNNNGGFSLLEVILAMAILAIISIPLLSYFTQSMKYNAMMADKQHATNLAQEVLEDLKNQKELAVVTTGAGFRVPYLEGKGYTLLSETPAAAPAPAFQAENVYYAAAGTSGSTYDVEVSVRLQLKMTPISHRSKGLMTQRMSWHWNITSCRKQ